MQLTPEQVEANWNRHLQYIDDYITGERKEKLRVTYESLAEHMVLAPASSKTWYHNAFPGGYVEHVNRVVELALRTMKFWHVSGATIDFTEEELVFAALNHDLGKIGDGEQDGYLPQTDNWRRDKLKEEYTVNTNLDFMLIQDRSLFLLQKYGISMSQKEYLGIRLHDGIFDDANKAYFFNHNPDSRFKTNIVFVLHQADFMASKIEYDRWLNTGGKNTPNVSKTGTSTGKTVKSSEGLSNLLQNI
jgi:hypothetical protein